MKLVTHKSVKETHEIELPYFMVSGNHFFKVLSEERAVMVHLGYNAQGDGCSVGNCFTSTAFNGEGTECTEEEFTTAFNEIFSELIKQTK